MNNHLENNYQKYSNYSPITSILRSQDFYPIPLLYWLLEGDREYLVTWAKLKSSIYL